MQQTISYFQNLLHTAFALHFGQEHEYATLEAVPLPKTDQVSGLVGRDLAWEEQVVLLLALMPHVHPQALDLFLIQNKQLDRPYSEFGGWKGTSHNGFLPTGETAAFLLSVGRPESRSDVVTLFSKTHWFHQQNILRLESQGAGEPFLSGKLSVSDELLAKVLHKGTYRPDYSSDFPAKRVDTVLDWDDLVLPYHLLDDLNDISKWLENEREIRSGWQLDRFVKRGYRCLFYGPPGTGKTLAASLLAKKHGMDIYRIDLSMIVSKYIGETEKNLSKIFDRAEHQNWILFFDEADALFGKRTDTNTSNDRHANQEVAYLLQRIEDFPGMIVLATNLKDNLDDAFFRRFQSALYFPIPDERLRFKLWKNMVPKAWLGDDVDQLLQEAAVANLSGGSIVNVVQLCAIRLYGQEKPLLNTETLKYAIRKEQEKQGKLVDF